MKNHYLSITFIILIEPAFHNLYSSSPKDKESVPPPGINCSGSNLTKADIPEIIFYSNGSSFSPVIKTDKTASILWTWDDNTTDNSATPVKNYGTAKLRQNRLRVTPWSAVQRINIGYDAKDGGPDSIELVKNQQVSAVKNISLVAPYLQAWCSSYNLIDSLNFSNFTNLKTIESYSSTSLRKAILTNTPKLKRICFEYNNLTEFDLRGCPALEDIRGALNKYSTIHFSNSTEELWHICVRANNGITDYHIFNNMTSFPNIAELLIWNTNQQGSLILRSTRHSSVSILANDNNYTSIDFAGALQSADDWGIVDLSSNRLTSVNIKGCIQIKELYLTHNNLSSAEIDHVLQQLDNLETTKGTADLRFNNPPTTTGKTFISNLKNKFWEINVDQETLSSELTDNTPKFKCYPNPVRENLTIELTDSIDEIMEVSIMNSNGKLIRLIHPQSAKIARINMETYLAGAYILKILTKKNYSFYKILHIKQD